MPGRFVSVTDARATLSLLLNALQVGAERAEPIFIGRHGAPVAVLLSMEHFKEYCALSAMRRRQLGLPPDPPTGSPAVPRPLAPPYWKTELSRDTGPV
jgi:prevent-host-death family protein